MFCEIAYVFGIVYAMKYELNCYYIYILNIELNKYVAFTEHNPIVILAMATRLHQTSSSLAGFITCSQNLKPKWLVDSLNVMV